MYQLPIAILLIGSVLIVPLVILLGGYIMRNMGSDRNNLVGYRTARSMSSPEAWLYANQECGRLWKRLGYILLWASPATMGIVIWLTGLTNFAAYPWAILAITGTQIGTMFWSIWQIEKKLRMRFDKDGA